MSNRVKMIVHEGRRYRPEDARRLGIKPKEHAPAPDTGKSDDTGKAVEGSEVENKAQSEPEGDKAARPRKGGTRARSSRSKPSTASEG